MSKKRSAASSGSKLPSSHTFFIDRSLGQKIVAQALRAAGTSVVIHDDHFPADAPDEEWLREVGQRGWIVLTRDKMIRYRDTERAAIIRAGVRAFVLRGKSLKGRPQEADKPDASKWPCPSWRSGTCAPQVQR